MFKSILLYLFAGLFLFGCASSVKTRYLKTNYFDLADKNMATQTNGGITVELFPLGSDEYKKSYYTQNIEVIYTPFLSTDPKREQKPFEIIYYDKLTAFKVDIINKTDHILRMRDSRIMFIDPDSDEPVMGLNKTAILEDIESTIPYYTKLKNHILTKYKQTQPDHAEINLTRAFSKITKKIKFINGFNKEIMPDMKSSGIVVFPVSPEAASQGKVSFIDMVSKTDKAGNPVERVRMDYSIKVLHKYWKYNQKTDADWVEINANEYQQGMSGN